MLSPKQNVYLTTSKVREHTEEGTDRMNELEDGENDWQKKKKNLCSVYDTATENMISKQLWLLALVLHTTGPVNIESWIEDIYHGSLRLLLS